MLLIFELNTFFCRYSICLGMNDPFVVRNMTFGIQDSIISTTGVLLGVAAAKFKTREIIITGLILIIVEALSMSYGTFLSDENFMKKSNEKYTIEQIIKYSLIMFVSYAIVGLILLAPFAFQWRYASSITILFAMIMLSTLVISFEHNMKKGAVVIAVGAALLAVSISLGKLTGGK